MMNSWIPDGSPIARPAPSVSKHSGNVLLMKDPKEAAEAMESILKFFRKKTVSQKSD